MNNKFSLAIVGGGAAGVSVFVQIIDVLIKRKILNFTIVLIEGNHQVGPGLAYSTSSDSNILNMRYHKMSVVPDEPDHVIEWISKNHKKWQKDHPDFDPDNDPFPSRSLYGLYLKDIFQQALRKAVSAGINVNVLHSKVLDAKKSGSSKYIILEDGTEIQATTVVFSLGNFPSTSYSNLKGVHNYFDSFWPDHQTISTTPKNADVCILGTRLTAIDAALTLLSHGHTGKIVLASRSGLLPKVQARHPHVSHKDLLIQRIKALRTSNKEKLRLKDVVKVFKQEIERLSSKPVNWDELLAPKGTAAVILAKDIKNAEANELPWQDILSSTSDIIENLWNDLEVKDKELFTKKYLSIWFVYRHGMPLKNAKRLLPYLKQGKIKVLSGVTGVKYDAAAQIFEIKFSDKTRKEKVVINATEAGLDITKLNSPLIENLLSRKLVSSNKFGGVNVDFETCRVVDGNGKIQKNMYFIGYLTRGVHFYTNDVARIAAHAKRVVENITQDI